MELLKEIYLRLVSKSPKLFNVISTISTICLIITGLPELLYSLGIELPQSWELIKNKTVLISSTISLFIARLTVDTPEATKQVLTKTK